MYTQVRLGLNVTLPDTISKTQATHIGDSGLHDTEEVTLLLLRLASVLNEALLSQTNADLKGKELAMRLMMHPDAEVQKQALLCVQKILLAKDKIAFLNSS